MDEPVNSHARRVLADPRWAALCGRDPTAAFFYAVATTGVYCRPSCASRRPRPENVTFHDSPAAAERAGYRPCKRCRPDQSEGSAERTLVTRLCRMIEAAEDPPALDALAAEASMGRARLRALFKRITGLTPAGYARAHRAALLRRGLETDDSVTAAYFGAGFNSSGRFYEQSGALLGMTPGAYRTGGAGAKIRFGVGQCSLGAILVAATDRGLCAIWLDDSPDLLVERLQRQFGQAALVGDDPDFARLMARAVALVEDPALPADLPLDIRCTAFQHRVWEALRQIPAGTTTTYKDLAETIGKPSAARAVARAVATNPVAVAIPCHRVVRLDGGLAGYRWGVARKRALLAREEK